MMGKMEIRSPPGSRPRDGRHCDLCGCSQPAVRCDKCGCQIFCLSCDDMYHRHPKRRFHLRKAVDPIPTVPQARPVLPVKVAHLNTINPGDPSKMPLPPPRKKKSLFGSFRKPSPTSDNSPPLPKKEYSWTDRLGSIKKFMSNRPLPPLPNPDDNNIESQPTTNGQSPRGDLTFIHRKNDERPPQLPQRSPKTPEFPGVNQEKENRIPSFPGHVHGQIRNGSMEPNANHMNQNREFPMNEENQWNNRMNNRTGPQVFGTLNRQTHQRGFMPQGPPGYPGGMHQSSSATDLHNMNNAEGMPGTGPLPPHYPHYPMNPQMPPHYPYPMYPQYPNYPQYFGNSFANLSNPPTSEGDFSDSESATRHSSKKHPFRKRAKRSQSVMMDRMAYPGQFFPFGPYPGYGPWGAPMPMEAPPSPASSVKSLTRAGRGRRRKKMTSEDDDDDEEFSVSSSPMSRPKSSSSDPKEHPKAPLASQTTSSEDESDEDAARRRNRIDTIRRQSEPVRVPSPAVENKQISKLKKSSSKHSDSDTQEIPEVKSERRPSKDFTTESPQLVQQKPPTPISSDIWECSHCTFMNPIGNRICQVCCKTASPRTETPVTGHSRPSSAAAANSRKESVGSEKECSSPDKVPETEDDSGKKDRQDMASLNSALDEAEKQISRGLEELMKLKDDIDSNVTKEKFKPPDNEPKSGNEENSKPTYRSSGKMRTSILDKLNLSKPQSSNASVSTSTETQTGNSNWTSDKIIEARRQSNSSTTSETYNSPMAQSPELDGNFLGNKQKRDSSCQTQQDTIADYLEKRKAAEEAFLGRPVNNFGFGYSDRMDMVTSPVPPMYDRFFGGGYGMMQRSHSRASLFTGRMNDMGPMDYGGPGFGYGPAPMYRSVSRGSLTGDYPDGRMSEFHNLRKPDFYLSMEELVERRRQDNIRAQGLELVRMIREAEQQGFNADDIQVALTHCGKQNPMEWLQENWRNMVDSVVTLSTNYGNDKKENDIGLMSENEARDALRLHKGNIWAAVTECVEGRQRKYLELSARGNFPRQDIVDALTSCEGDVEIAYAKLTKSTGKPFLMRIWGAGEGAQNQDGAQPIPDDYFDGPRRYLKDETLHSDEMSEELWSEDGEWDDDEEFEERGDIEDLQTCHEDLQTSPQEMRTPESDKSDYCDAFPTDDRNASSPSDDIFFVIPEAKPEKKKGFLSKLAAFRKDSKEQSDAILNSSKDVFAAEQSVQLKEDTISQKSNSSSEQPKNNGALNALKSTLSAIKDTVTGGTKSDKKLPCAQPERRTIIVKGQIENESLSNNSKENAKLSSVKLLDEATSSRTESENEYNEPTKQADDSSNKESKSLEANLKSQPNKNNSENTPDQVQSKSKVENKKPQSLAERLKFAKQTRSATSNSSTSALEKENSIHDSKLNDGVSAEIGKGKVSSNEINKNFTNSEKKAGSNLELDLPSPDVYIKRVEAIDAVADTNRKSQPLASQSGKTAARTQNDAASSIATVSPETSPILSPQDPPREFSVKNKAALPESETPSTKFLNSKNLKSINQIKQGASSDIKSEKLTNKTTSGNRPQSVSPKLEFQKIPEGNSTKNSGKEINKNSKIKSPDITKPISDPKSDISKVSSSVLDNKMVSEVEKNGNILEKQKTAKTAEEQVLSVSSVVENIPILSDIKNVNETTLKGTTSKDISERDKSLHETSKTQAEHVEIPQTVNKLPKTATTSEYEKNSSPGTSDNQNSEFKSENTANSSVIQENKVEEMVVTMTESKAIKNNLDGQAIAGDIQNVTAEESLSNKQQNAEGFLKIQSSKSSEEQSEIKPNKVEATITIQEGSSVQISVENDVPKTEVVSTSQLKEQLPNLPTTSAVQNIPESIVEQSTTENSKMEIDSNKEKTAELAKPEQTNTESNLNSTVAEKDVVSEQITGPPEASVQANETKMTNDAEASSENSQDTADGKLNLGKDTPVVLLENKNDPSSSSVADTKSGKIKSGKTTKIKKSKSQENVKKESKDKIQTASESLKSSPSSLSKLSSITSEKDGKDVSYDNTSEASSSNESPEDKSLAEKIISDKETENKYSSKVSQAESKVIAEETDIKVSEESKLQTSDDGDESLTIENAAEISSEPKQNTSTSAQQNSLSKVEVIPSTSKDDQTDFLKTPKPSDNEQKADNSKEAIQNSSEINKVISNETELQESKVSNQVQDDKSSPATDITTSENVNIANNSAVISTPIVSDNSEMMAASSSTEVPLDDKMVTSSTSALDNSKTIAASTSSTTSDISETTVAPTSSAAPDDSKTAVASTSSVAADSSKTTVASTSSDTADNSKTTVASTSVPSSSKTTAALSSAVIPDSSINVAVSSSVPDIFKIIEASTSTTISNNSNVATSGISKAVTGVKSLNKEMIQDTTLSTVPELAEQHSKVHDNAITDIPTSANNEISSPASTVFQSENNLLKRMESEDGSTSQAADSDDSDIEDYDESGFSNVTPPSPVDALRSRFEGLVGNSTIRGGPVRPASPFRRMSFNSRKQVIALEKKRDTSADKPWFHQRIVNEPPKLPQPKRTIKQQLEMERKVRKMVADRKCRTYRKAEIVVQLMDMNFGEEEAIQAANECSTLELAISYLQQECLLCTGHFPVSQIVSMTHCEHRACRECIRAYFTVQIRDRTILDLLCPFCNEPDIGDEDVAQDYFNHLDIMLKKLVDFEIHELFQRKLRDRVLMKDPNFRWCSQCSSGFIAMPNLKRLICPDCNAVTCASCRRLWEREHQGISCEAFAALKDASDPEAQAAGLAKMLTEDGIDCPCCHFRYALAKGGCMHFRCIQCQHDFCSGCSRPFKMGQKCGVSEFCAKLGLHAHHPRNCLFYLRDKEPEDLQKLLDMNDVKFNREPPDGMELKITCQVMEQKETPDGMLDDYCGKEVQDGYAGLCRVHYVEYLGQLVNKYKVDPIQIFDNDDLELVLRRANIRLPPKRYRETDLQYREKLVNLIEDELPLDKMDGS